MTSKNRRCLWLASALIAPHAWAHHSPASFDMTRAEVLEGVVSSVSWRNPHVYFEIEIAGENGETVAQPVEAGPASNLATLGFDGSSIQPGEHVTVEIRPNRRGSGTVLGWLLTKADGTAIPLHVRASPETAPGEAAASSIAGTWVPQGTSFTELASVARQWPLTERGRAAIEATQDARNASRAACMPFGPPALMELPSVIVVDVSESEVRFHLDVMDTQRVVHLDLAAHPDDLEPSLHGHSIGRWEGTTLVVDTIGYADLADGYAFDLPSSASKHVVERFAISADRKHLEYEAIVEDPGIFAEVVSHRAIWDYRPEQPPANLPCDAEAASRFAVDP